jgi:hypothetical protein
MSVALIAPGRAMFRAPFRTVLWRPLRTAPPTPGGGGGGSSGSAPNAIPGLSGWWDASSFANMEDANGVPLAGWNLPAAAISDLSGNHRPATPYHFAASGTNTPVATPRVSGLLGGCGYDLRTGPYYPTLDYDLGFQVPNLPMGADAPWTRFFVWSRPNWKQNPYTSDTTAHALLTSGGTPVLTMDGSAGSGRLTLFPGAASAVLSSALTRRHTHSVILRHTPGAGVDVWLDGALAATGVANPVAGQGLATLLLLHGGNGYSAGGQCWFHELAAWERAPTGTEIAGLGTYASRWALGPRKAVALMFNGQSNARNAVDGAGADLVIAQGVAWYLGAIAWSRASRTQQGGVGTMNPGMGLYYYPETASPAYAGTFLQDPLDGSDPATWALGAMGEAVQAWVQSLSAEDLADVGALVIWWNETDSYRTYGEKARFGAAAKRWLALFRGMFAGATPASLPVIWWNGIPFGNTDGVQMHREVVVSLVADPALNVVLGNPMTADSNDLNASYDKTTGIQIGGDNQHRDFPDLVTFAQRAAPVVARALLAAGRADSLGTIPAGLPDAGGPKIIHVWRESSTSVVLTVQHDAGNDLRVPLQAAQGAGFLVMDGGSVTSPGALIPATACARIDATHLRITLAQPLTQTSAQCLLFYPYGSYAPAGAPGYTGDLGRGNAVTDNFASLPKPAGWDIGAELGSAWNIDFPLAATAAPIALSDAP